MANLNFNARTVAPEAPRTPIPAGVYTCVITESDVKSTQNGGQMLVLTHQVIDGPHKGRLVWNRINIRNPSAEAERIGQAQLSSLCHAVNVLDLMDSSMLHSIPVRVRVSIRPAGPDRTGTHRDEQNEVKGYEGVGKGQPAAPAPSQPLPSGAFQAPAVTPAAPAAAATAGAKPWARRTATAA